MKQNNSEELKKEIIEKFENLNPIGNLFDVINYSSYENLDKFIVNMNEEQALGIADAIYKLFKKN